ncbi:protein UXT homolog [Diabrotica virgifera virgifera]|uniref:Protein UXT homolog n=1 Tax=Diabrotica virgifera virgifera TaxID=50390 RepID=A0A6P7F9P6_DIAVI|nr:protein UXT homolog [Diabrotica virgifera virgifera]
MNVKEVQEKVKEYENFIEDKLKPDLEDIVVILKDKSTKLKDWEEVKTTVKTVRRSKEKDRDMVVKVDIGGGILAQGEISDLEQIYVDVGLGYMLEMNHQEADRYADIRMNLLKKEIAHFRKMAVDVKVNIKLILLALSELQATVTPTNLLTNNK